MPEKPYRYGPLLISICLVAAIIAVYWPVYKYDFVRYDDGAYITNNANIKSGLNWKSVCWAFTTGYQGNWYPVTWVSHIIDYQLFKDWAGGYHITNILFHILNTLILFYVLMRMTGTVWPSAFVAAAFALHPLHVESVAWIAERKDVLSTFFWLLTMWAYIRYAENPKFKWYLATFVLFILGLMSKPMLVTVPFVLLLLDFWPLERRISWRLLIEKIPFFICSIASSIVTFFVQQNSKAVVALSTFGFKVRIGNAIVSYITYVTKMIWPSQLAVLYPHPGGELSPTKVIIYGLLLILISIYFISLAKRYRFPAVGWFWYLGTLVPVIGLVQVGAQAIADRYTYMTLTGLFIIIAWGAKEFIPKWRYKNVILISLAVIVSTAWALTASRQLRYWENSLTLFEHTLQITKNNSIILCGYASSLANLNRFDQAIECFNKSLKIKPDLAEAYDGLGLTLEKTGKVSEAIEQFRLAIKYKPDFIMAYNNLAVALRKQGRNEEAVDCLEQALKLKPDFIKARLNLGLAFYSLREFDKAIESFNKVLESEADNAMAHANLGLSLVANGRIDEGIEEIRFVLKAEPNNAKMHLNLGILLEQKGEIAEAIKSYHKALEINPFDMTSHQLLEAALKKQESLVNK